MSKKFNKNIQYTFNPQINLATSSVLTITGNSNTIGNIFTTGGNVGIGTTSPSTKLHLRDNGSVTLLIEADADNVTETDVVNIKLRQDGGGQGMDIGIDSVNQSYIDFGTGNAGVGTNGFHIRCSTGSMLMITTSGNVGIGTTDPLYSLQVDGNVALNVMPGINSVGSIKIGRQDFNARWHMINCNNGTAASLNNMIFNLHNATTSTTVAPVLTLRGDGSVGIGTTSPTSDLHVNGNYSNYQNSTTGYLLLSQGWAANAGFVSFHQADGTRKGYIGYGGTTEAFLLQGEGARKITIATNNVDRITITSGGNVGIGTTTPTYTLDVNGTLEASNSNGLMLFASSGNVGINTTNPSSLLDVANGSDTSGVGGGPQIAFQYRTSSGGGFRHFIRSRHNAISSNHNGNGIDFYLNNLNTATGSSAPGTGNVCTLSVTGSGVGFGTTTPSWPIHVTTNNGNYTWPASGYYFTTTTSIAPAGAGGSSINNSILAAGAITSNVGFYATSDIRIKKILKQGIQEIDISQIDKLDITKFEYIDKLAHGNDSKLGFIAQNVFEFVPEAVTIRKEFVPNIFKVTSVSDKVIELTGHNLTVGTKIKIMIDEQDRNGTVIEITTIIDENHFCINYDLENKDKLFIYGTEVDDFKELNYNHIFTLSVGAVQKLRQDVHLLEDKYEKLANFIQEKFAGEYN